MSTTNMKFGDILAFNSDDLIAKIINRASGGNVSHVAFVMDSTTLIESTSLDDTVDENGVFLKSIKEKIEDYEGTVWHLSLEREVVNIAEAKEYALSLIGTPYDFIQASMSALDMLLDAKEDFNALFCSELNVSILKRCKHIKEVAKEPILPRFLNSSEITPIDLCRLKLYKECNLIKGTGKISRFNTINIGDFNEY